MIEIRSNWTISNNICIFPVPKSSSNATTRPKRTSKYGSKSCTTEIYFHNTDAKTLIKYDNDGTLDIKDEFIQGMAVDKKKVLSKTLKWKIFN